MSAVLVPTGDFTGWDRKVTELGEVMVWNWPRDLSPMDAAFERCFEAVAIGTISGDLVIRTEPDVPPVIVAALQHVISNEAAAGKPVGISLLLGNAAHGTDPTRVYASLYCPAPRRLNTLFNRMSKYMRKAS